MPDNNIERYSLDAETHQKILIEILHERLDPIPAAKTTAATIFIGGQPGAGKSSLTDSAMDELEWKAVLVDPDELRESYPGYEALQEENDRLAAARSHQDASAWADELFNAAVEKGCNIVIDGTMRNGGSIARQCRQVRQAYYHTEARVIAVSPLASRLGIHKRYEEQKQKGKFGRWLEREIHDRAYAGLSQTVEKLEREKLVDRISIYNRSGDLLYDNTLADGEWQKPPAARATLESERNRSWTQEECSQFNSEIKKVIVMMKQRSAPPAQFHEMNAIREDFERQIAPPVADYQDESLADEETEPLQDTFHQDDEDEIE